MAKKKPAKALPDDAAPLTPSMGMVVLVYTVVVIFIWYLIYEYDPITVHRLFSWLFDPLID